MGPITIIMIYIVLMQLITPLVQLGARKLLPCIKRKSLHLEFIFDQVTRLSIFKANRYTAVNTWIRFFLEAYIEVLISSLLALFSSKTILEKSQADSIAIVSGALTAIVIVCFTLLVLLQSFYLVRMSVIKQKLELTQNRL